jgi:uncharacterized protein YfiM (DUF2279 family)
MAAIRRYICPFIVMFIVLKVSIESYGISIHPSRDSSKVHFLDYSRNFNKKRLIAVIGTESALYAGVMVGLYNYWYKDLGLSKFHFFNDGNEWRGVDKAGHFMTAYTYTYFGYETFKWAGVSKRKSLWYSFAGSNFLQLSLEFFDGLLRYFSQYNWDEPICFARTNLESTEDSNQNFEYPAGCA